MQDHVVVFHHEHLYHNACQEAIHGPYTEREAQEVLAGIVVTMKDTEFKLSDDGEYAGYSFDDLVTAKRDTDLCSEIWAEIVPLTPR
jgi:hypothetical protein